MRMISCSEETKPDSNCSSGLTVTAVEAAQFSHPDGDESVC